MTLKAAISRTVTPLITSPALRGGRRRLHAATRRLCGRSPTVDYFHQVDDPYSHLAAQALIALRDRYEIDLRCHLVPAPDDGAAPERARLEAWSRRDAQDLARRLDLDWPAEPVVPQPDAVQRANAVLAAAVDRQDFVESVVAIGAALWRDELDAVVDAEPADTATTDRRLQAGAALRRTRGHYLGATFHFEGEWYWGVDRLHYLESRLREAGLAANHAQAAAHDFIAPVKDVELLARPKSGVRPQLHFFFSFRSPYVCISVARVRRLAEHYGADLRLRFILPMVMRGLPVPRAKRSYIVLDAKREAERVGAPFGCIVDPVGRATERGIAVLHRAIDDGRSAEFVESFLRGVWAEGIDATTASGLQRIAERAGIDGSTVTAALQDDSWRAPAEANRQELFEMGLWGAPTLRVDDRPGHWGQDRLWVIEEDLIAATGAERG